MFFFLDFGVILVKNRKSTKTRKSGYYRAPTLQRREPTPWHRPTPRLGIPSPWQARGAKNGTPRVLHSAELLCRGVATVHNKQYLIFFFVSEHLIFVHR